MSLPPRNSVRQPGALPTDIDALNDIVQRRQNALLGNVTAIRGLVNPNAVKSSVKEDAAEARYALVDGARHSVVDPDGSVRAQRLLAVGLSLAAVIGVMVWLRQRRNRRA